MVPTKKKIVNARGEGDFTPLTSGGFGTGDKEELPAKVDMLPKLAEELAPPHPGIKRHNNDGAEMRSCCLEQQRFIFEA